MNTRIMPLPTNIATKVSVKASANIPFPKKAGLCYNSSMRIFIAGSMSFAKEIMETKVRLRRFGFESTFAPDTYECYKNPHLKLNENLEHCERYDIIRACMDVQKQCDAILLLNYPKNGVNGYIGSNCLIELGLAYYLNQRIFLLYAPPPQEKARYHVEVMHMKPIILNGNLNEMKRYANQESESGKLGNLRSRRLPRSENSTGRRSSRTSL